MFTPDIKTGMEMNPGDWFIETSDGQKKLRFKTKAEADEAKEFMSHATTLARRSGEIIAANRVPEFKTTLQEHIEQCENVLFRINGI